MNDAPDLSTLLKQAVPPAGHSTGSSKCAPEQYVNNAPDPSLPHNGEINPCGLIAWSFFNDSYSAAMAGPGGAPVPLQLDVRAQAPICKHPSRRGLLLCHRDRGCSPGSASARRWQLSCQISSAVLSRSCCTQPGGGDLNVKCSCIPLHAFPCFS